MSSNGGAGGMKSRRGGANQASTTRTRPSPASSATYGEGRMPRNDSGSRLADRPGNGDSIPEQHPSQVPASSSDQKVGVLDAKFIMDSMNARVSSVEDRMRSWKDLPDSEKKNRKRRMYFHF